MLVGPIVCTPDPGSILQTNPFRKYVWDVPPICPTRGRLAFLRQPTPLLRPTNARSSISHADASARLSFSELIAVLGSSWFSITLSIWSWQGARSASFSSGGRVPRRRLPPGEESLVSPWLSLPPRLPPPPAVPDRK